MKLPDFDAERLIALLSEQRDLYVRLRGLGEQQRTLIASDRPERLVKILGERQTLVVALVRLNEQLAPFRRDWDAIYAALPEPTRQQAAGFLSEMSGLLRSILDRDRDDSALLAARQRAVAQDLAELSGGRSVHAAYSRQVDPEPRRSTRDVAG